MATRDLNSGQYVGSRQVLDKTPADLPVQASAVTTGTDEITTDGILMHPDSPHPLNFQWLGTQAQFDILGSYDLLTEYSTLPNTALWFITQDVSPITPVLTGVTPDSSSIGSVEGSYTSNAAPSYNYLDDSIEHLIEFTNFDPLLATGFIAPLDGIVGVLDVSNLTNLEDLWVYQNPLLHTISGLPLLTAMNGALQIQSCLFAGNLTLPIAPALEYIDISDNVGLTSLDTLLGLTSATTILSDGCALDSTTVGNLITDTDTNGLSNGTLNVSGGTNALVPLSAQTALTSILGKGWTVTHNGLEV